MIDYPQRLASLPRFAVKPGSKGMTRAEVLWILGLSLLLLWIILASLNSDLRQTKQRLATQQMEYLAGQLRFSMREHKSEMSQWPSLSVGPGTLPESPDLSLAAPLNGLLPSDMYLPMDPWGGAYIFRKDPAADRWVIQCVGPEPGDMQSIEDAYLTHEIFPPAP